MVRDWPVPGMRSTNAGFPFQRVVDWHSVQLWDSLEVDKQMTQHARRVGPCASV
jgi:hypothetical protein